MTMTLGRLVACAAAIFALAACAASWPGNGSMAGGPRPSDSVDGSSAPSGSDSPSGTTPAGTESAAPPDRQEIQTEIGFSTQPSRYSDEPDVTVAAVLSNPSPKAACDVKAVFNALDAGGVTIKTETERLDWIPGRGQAIVAPLLFDPPVAPASITVTVVVDAFRTAADLSDCKGYSMLEGVELPVSGLAIDRSSEYSQKIVGQVSNPTSEVVTLAMVNCVLRAGGAIVGGVSSTIADPIVPGGTVAMRASVYSFIPDGTDNVQCQVLA